MTDTTEKLLQQILEELQSLNKKLEPAAPENPLDRFKRRLQES
jgi:hypothetical protein